MLAQVARLGPRVDVVVGGNAPALERFAAEELAGQFRRLFDADVKIADKAPAQFTHLIYVGRSADQPRHSIAFRNVAQALRSRALVADSAGRQRKRAWWWEEARQSRPSGRPTNSGSGSGVRYMLFGDLYPIAYPPMKLDSFDVVLEPALRVRTLADGQRFSHRPRVLGIGRAGTGAATSGQAQVQSSDARVLSLAAISSISNSTGCKKKTRLFVVWISISRRRRHGRAVRFSWRESLRESRFRRQEFLRGTNRRRNALGPRHHDRWRAIGNEHGNCIFSFGVSARILGRASGGQTALRPGAIDDRARERHSARTMRL